MQSKEAIALAQETGTAQVTDWVSFNDYGYTAYRIHFNVDRVLRRYFQTHEWMSADGSTEMENPIMVRLA